jgi:hypothetical protein
MFALGGRGRVVGRVEVPVVPADVAATGDCDACGRGAKQQALRARAVVEGVEMTLCVDFFSCASAYRGGATPGEYAELMAVSS